MDVPGLSAVSGVVESVTDLIPDVSVLDLFRYAVGITVTVCGVIVIIVGVWTGIADIAGLIMVAAGLAIIGFQGIAKSIGNLLPG